MYMFNACFTYDKRTCTLHFLLCSQLLMYVVAASKEKGRYKRKIHRQGQREWYRQGQRKGKRQRQIMIQTWRSAGQYIENNMWFNKWQNVIRYQAFLVGISILIQCLVIKLSCGASRTSAVYGESWWSEENYICAVYVKSWQSEENYICAVYVKSWQSEGIDNVMTHWLTCSCMTLHASDLMKIYYQSQIMFRSLLQHLCSGSTQLWNQCMQYFKML